MLNSAALCDLAIHALEDTKGIDIVKLDVQGSTVITDYMIICTASSITHLKALAENVVVKAKMQKLSVIRAEGNKETGWMLVDLGAAIVHVMLRDIRELYSLEDLWGPIKTLRKNARN